MRSFTFLLVFAFCCLIGHYDAFPSPKDSSSQEQKEMIQEKKEEEKLDHKDNDNEEKGKRGFYKFYQTKIVQIESNDQEETSKVKANQVDRKHYLPNVLGHKGSSKEASQEESKVASVGAIAPLAAMLPPSAAVKNAFVPLGASPAADQSSAPAADQSSAPAADQSSAPAADQSSAPEEDQSSEEEPEEKQTETEETTAATTFSTASPTSEQPTTVSTTVSTPFIIPTTPDFNSCKYRPCQHGTCKSDPNGVYACECYRYWAGDFCTIEQLATTQFTTPTTPDMSSCRYRECKNGGTCKINTNGVYACKCPSGWFGDFCTIQRPFGGMNMFQYGG